MNTHSKAITTLVLGIVGVVSIFLGPLSFLGLIAAIVGIVFGVQLKKELTPGDEDYNYANIGFILSIIGVALAGIGVVCTVIGLVAFGQAMYHMPMF